MKKFFDLVDQAHDKMPYCLKDSPLDPAFLVFMLPFFLGYVAVILLTHLV